MALGGDELKSINQSINQPTSQSINQSTSQSINQSMFSSRWLGYIWILHGYLLGAKEVHGTGLRALHSLPHADSTTDAHLWGVYDGGGRGWLYVRAAERSRERCGESPGDSEGSTGKLFFIFIFIPPATKLGGVYWIQPVCLSVCPSVRLSVCPLTFSCPPCSIYSSWWILSIFGTNDQ